MQHHKHTMRMHAIDFAIPHINGCFKTTRDNRKCIVRAHVSYTEHTRTQDLANLLYNNIANLT